jgi:pathogenesis-related protein 1
MKRKLALLILLIGSCITLLDAQTCALCDEFLAAHNTIRAIGPYGPGNPVPSPPLSPVTWSTSLATTAANWAAGCVWGHNPGRGFVGENLYAQTGTSGTATTAVNFWGAEAQNYNWYTNTCAAGQDCSHYTQIVWASTTQVGCAVQICPAGVGTPPPGFTGDWTYIVCNYSPPGNIIGQRPYAAAVPTAADVTLSGRVVTYEGRGIANARVTISGGGMSSALVFITGRRGEYRFDHLRSGETYVVTVSQPRYNFAQPTYTVTMNDNLSNANFVADPPITTGEVRATQR